MSRDFSPRECWYANKMSKCDAWLQNITYSYGGKSWDMYTEDELTDRRSHKALAVLGADIYKTVKEMLNEKQFESFNVTLEKLIAQDESNGCTSGFPKEITDWYFNRHNHYYHEPNDQELLEFLEKTVKEKTKDDKDI